VAEIGGFEGGNGVCGKLGLGCCVSGFFSGEDAVGRSKANFSSGSAQGLNNENSCVFTDSRQENFSKFELRFQFDFSKSHVFIGKNFKKLLFFIWSQMASDEEAEWKRGWNYGFSGLNIF
jgi:hypothetical protein